MPSLEREMTYRVWPTGPLSQTGPAPGGAREYWEMTKAELEGPRIRASSPSSGIDWFLTAAPGELGRPNVHVQFITDDGALVLLHYTGLVRATPAFNQAAQSKGSTSFADQYMRMSLTFVTGARKYAWLTESLWVAEGRLDKGWVEYDVYRVT